MGNPCSLKGKVEGGGGKFNVSYFSAINEGEGGVNLTKVNLALNRRGRGGLTSTNANLALNKTLYLGH